MQFSIEEAYEEYLRQEVEMRDLEEKKIKTLREKFPESTRSSLIDDFVSPVDLGGGI